MLNYNVKSLLKTFCIIHMVCLYIESHTSVFERFVTADIKKKDPLYVLVPLQTFMSSLKTRIYPSHFIVTKRAKIIHTCPLPDSVLITKSREA